MASLAWVLVIMAVVIIAFLVFSYPSIISSINRLWQSSGGVSGIADNLSLYLSSAVGECNSQINALTPVIETEVPRGSAITVVDITTFSYNQNTSVTSRQILTWAQALSSYYTDNQELPAYIEHDAAYAAIGDNRTHHAGIGEVVRVTVPAGDFETTAPAGTRLTPLLCDFKGNLLPGSKNNTVWS